MSPPGREIDFVFEFSYGVNDLVTSLDWLKKVGRLPEKYATIQYEKLSDNEYRAITKEISAEVKQVWADIESDFAPKRSKYA